jgi:hypothetical protein
MVRKIEGYDMRPQKQAFTPSRRFTYYNEGVIEETVSSDPGGQIVCSSPTSSQTTVAITTCINWPQVRHPTRNCHPE